ncbi:MAG: hypothetical protein KC877_03055 [Candidatus Kaiserbacteria bacterium]|nr:hypothetical protein [Candidatus Kaiserbacteria bacterium]MCB9815759.1 hypothetical protein [Candidatus Nomurabacteria bacterium]
MCDTAINTFGTQIGSAVGFGPGRITDFSTLLEELDDGTLTGMDLLDSDFIPIDEISDDMLLPGFQVRGLPEDSLGDWPDYEPVYHGHRDYRHDCYRMFVNDQQFEAPLGNRRAEEIFEQTGVWTG